MGTYLLTQPILHSGAKPCSAPSGEKRKVSFTSSVSGLGNKKQKRSDTKKKWCFQCAKADKAPRTVTNHDTKDFKAINGDKTRNS